MHPRTFSGRPAAENNLSDGADVTVMQSRAFTTLERIGLQWVVVSVSARAATGSHGTINQIFNRELCSELKHIPLQLSGEIIDINLLECSQYRSVRIYSSGQEVVFSYT